LLGEPRHTLVVKIRAGHVNEFGGLLLDGSDYFRMAVPRRADSNPRSKIQKGVAVNVLDNRAVAALGHKRVIPRVRRRHELGVAFHNALGVGSGQSGNQLW